MATWKQLGKENLESANMLLESKKFRSATSRAYYAAFSAVNEVFERGGFMKGLRTPSHLAIPRLIEHTLSRVSMITRRKMMAEYRELYALRIGADYKRGQTVDRQTSLKALKLAGNIIRGCNV